MKNTFRNIAAAIMISGLFFVPVFGSAQTIGNIVTGHTYTVLGTYEQDGIVYVVLKNPWGVKEEMEEDDYLKILQENRQFTMVSNILKVKQDTSKSSINNIR